MRFQVGQTVRRIGPDAHEIKTGGTGVVDWVSDAGISIRLRGHGDYRYEANRFEIVPQTTAGRKDDSGKLDMNLLDDMPRAVKAVVQVMQWAITDKKPTPYERGSWQGVHADRYRAAIKRHDRDACEQATADVPARFQKDKETNLPHLAHIATSAMMALENALREQEAK